MKKFFLIYVLLLTFNLLAEDEIVVDKSITTVSQGARTLLSTEMRFIEQNMKEILYLMVAGEYEEIKTKAIDIQNSFVFKKSITKVQLSELKSKLPKHFFQTDFEFHDTAGQMAQAAEMEDANLIAEKYYNIIKTCIKCHSIFATHKFPNLIE